MQGGDWSTYELLALLQGVMECGDNWPLISMRVGGGRTQVGSSAFVWS